MRKQISAIVLAVLMAGSACALTACHIGDNTAEKQAYVSLDINPAIELVVDKDRRVVSVRAQNEDAQVLLYEEAGIRGEKIDTAIQKITELAVQYGYLDESNQVVSTLVSSPHQDFADEVLSKVNTSVTVTAQNLGLRVTTDAEGAYSLLRQMDEVKKQFPRNEAVQNMSVSKFSLALSVSETDGISLDAAIALDDAQLIGMLREAEPKIEEFATAAYREAKAQALAVYDQATALAIYSVYTQYYMERILSHPFTAYYGGVYQMYASAAKAFEIICDMAQRAANVRTYPLNQEQVSALMSVLGMESADALKNARGEITIDSVEAYADKLFKNTPASETLEQTKVALSEALAQVQESIKSAANEVTAEYKPQIEAALQNARQVIASADDMMRSMPENVQIVLNAATADLKDILAQIDAIVAGEKIPLDVLREKAARLQAKADEYLNKIREDLSEEEWAQLEERKAAAVEKMSGQKKILEKALDDAEQAAREYLAQQKRDRKKEA